MTASEARKNTINDCYVDVHGVKPTDEHIAAIFRKIPSDIKELADKWGWYDTEVRGMVYRLIEEEAEKCRNTNK